ELALIIGRGGRHIEAADAMSHVFGYACYNDVSLRDFQRHASQFTPGKNFPATGAFGPYLVTADEMGELKGKRIQTRLNGEIMQDATL
ncbi:MAG: 5-carboxymethyl-2-hydroxymuconate isomerase, partial [Woeseiaceae bacterium]|nr:5-carboxymethyl-2-hydroxymuconate isomerase [Woeseiaceae bacterium]NIP21574.1 5-carboxymethyl-2-hydroxymuconate isomerase [Woeseiaceae bacterium]